MSTVRLFPMPRCGSVRYEDPKAFDDTQEEAVRYDEL